ncbi:unnamed protein product [Protopolystoma xenopodis]|uniref:Uncharacterized protein n=1 Tax=Protopolystoma xenopodis TaxID=117903 RepID=A0A3S5ANJ3_9PLAT|nr:unnamed protein product [Protopolystoma xenopodis]
MSTDSFHAHSLSGGGVVQSCSNNLRRTDGPEDLTTGSRQVEDPDAKGMQKPQLRIRGISPAESIPGFGRNGAINRDSLDNQESWALVSPIRSDDSYLNEKVSDNGSSIKAITTSSSFIRNPTPTTSVCRSSFSGTTGLQTSLLLGSTMEELSSSPRSLCNNLRAGFNQGIGANTGDASQSKPRDRGSPSRLITSATANAPIIQTRKRIDSEDYSYLIDMPSSFSPPLSPTLHAGPYFNSIFSDYVSENLIDPVSIPLETNSTLLGARQITGRSLNDSVSPLATALRNQQSIRERELQDASTAFFTFQENRMLPLTSTAPMHNSQKPQQRPTNLPGMESSPNTLSSETVSHSFDPTKS